MGLAYLDEPSPYWPRWAVWGSAVLYVVLSPARWLRAVAGRAGAAWRRL